MSSVVPPGLSSADLKSSPGRRTALGRLESFSHQTESAQKRTVQCTARKLAGLQDSLLLRIGGTSPKYLGRSEPLQAARHFLFAELSELNKKSDSLALGLRALSFPVRDGSATDPAELRHVCLRKAKTDPQ